MTTPAEIDAVRRFNRFHTGWTGALDGQLRDSGYPLPLARVLHEVATAPPGCAPSVQDLGRRLQLDPGDLGRLVDELEHDGLVVRTPSPLNDRRLELALSVRGRAAFGQLDAASARHVGSRLDALSDGERRDVVAAMACIRRLLDTTAPDAGPLTAAGRGAEAVVLRDPRPGDIGYVVHRQARLYAEEHGWDGTIEAMLADIGARFLREFRPGRERCWVAERGGEVVGSVFVVREDDDTARLRMLHVERAVRGAGLGRRLVDEAIAFAAAAGYRRMVLWTNDALVSARRIYEAAGFALVEEQAHRAFGRAEVGQVWARDL